MGQLRCLLVLFVLHVCFPFVLWYGWICLLSKFIFIIPIGTNNEQIRRTSQCYKKGKIGEYRGKKRRWEWNKRWYGAGVPREMAGVTWLALQGLRSGRDWGRPSLKEKRGCKRSFTFIIIIFSFSRHKFSLIKSIFSNGGRGATGIANEDKKDASARDISRLPTPCSGRMKFVIALRTCSWEIAGKSYSCNRDNLRCTAVRFLRNMWFILYRKCSAGCIS